VTGADHPLAASLRGVVIENLEQLQPHLEGWDSLAAAAARPFCAPAWMLSWWREGRTGDARLRIVVVLDADGSLAGVGPFFAQVGAFGLAEYRLLAAGFSHRIGPLARPGLERLVAAAIAGALAGADPPPASVVFEGIDQADGWAELVAGAWPGPRRLRSDVAMDAPEIELDGDYEAWMTRRGRKFRKEARRTARRLEEQGVQGKLALDANAIDALVRLHDARWKERGGSNIGEEARRVVAGAAEALGGDMSRIAISLLESPDGPIAAELIISAGDGMAFWAGGFDPAWAQHAPGTQAMLTALAAGAQRGVKLADLGGGAHEYKRRMADANAPVAWRTVFPLGPRYPLIRLVLAPKHLRYGLLRVFRRLSPETQRRIRRVLRGE
jgi:CelD/BcsL family acetyltransferase involved in cellulose biosynthesis